MQTEIRDAINAALNELGVEPVDFVVEHPSDLSHGDYATNVAMVAAKKVGKNPRMLAEEISTKLTDFNTDIAGPGFINFHLPRDFFSEKITHINDQGKDWGKNDLEKDQVVLVEYTSPNLFKPLHVGNLVGNIVGESFTRLFEAAGADVKRMNYPSDIGLPVAKAVWGLKETGNDPTQIEELGEAYRVGNEAYEKDGSEKEEIIAINQALYAKSDPELNKLRDSGVFTSKYSINTICASLGTFFDKEIFESEAAPVGTEVVKANVGNVFKESDGAVVYEGEKVGLHTRVFLNSRGLPTYEAKDVGHYLLKQQAYPDFTKSIIVTGGEQAEYFKVVYAALNELFPETKSKHLEHIPTGFLALTTGKMSSRKGNVLSGEEILADLEKEAVKRGSSLERENENSTPLATKIATAAIKYEILRHGVGSNIVFDKAKALSFEGASGPYLQYTNARINSALRKAEEVGVVASADSKPGEPYKIEKLIYRFEEVVVESLVDRAPQKMVTFLTELAGEFNTFYAQEKIADANDEYAPYKAAIAQAVGQTLKNGLWLLGIEAPERM